MYENTISSLLTYSVILACYVPGIVIALRLKSLARMPVITFSFFGMLFFTAIGSWLVLSRENAELGSLVSDGYIKMLVFQCLLFYVVVGPYLLLKKNFPAPDKAVKTDEIVRAVLMILTIGILTMYYLKVGKFLLFDLLDGRINRLNVLDYRALTYGLKEYPFFRLGFLVFPGLIAALSVGIASRRGRLNIVDVSCVVFSLIPPLLLAEKSAILQMAVVIFIAYTLEHGLRGKSLSSALSKKVVALGLLSLAPTLAVYFVYFESGSGFTHIFNQMFFRIFGVYSEALAGVARYTEVNGFLHGATFPDFKGLFPHERIFIDVLMHAFLAAGSELKGTAMLGAVPVPAIGEGFLNFGWLGFFIFGIVAFGCVVLVQELMLRLRIGATSSALMVWHAYLGLTLSTTSLFGTYISLIHGLVALGVVMLWCLVRRLLEEIARLKAHREVTNFPKNETLTDARQHVHSL